MSNLMCFLTKLPDKYWGVCVLHQGSPKKIGVDESSPKTKFSFSFSQFHIVMLSKKARSKAAREKINDVDRAFAKDFWSRIPTNLNLEDPIQHRAWQALGKPAVLPEDFGYGTTVKLDIGNAESPRM